MNNILKKRSINEIDQWRLNLLKAVEAQANDETLWIDSDIDGSYITQSYIIQSLRWLHRVIEENDKQALAWIIAQSKGKI